MPLRSQRAFLLCLLASLALHALVLSRFPDMPSIAEQRAAVVQAELRPVEPPPLMKTPPETPLPSRTKPRSKPAKVPAPSVALAPPQIPPAPALTSDAASVEPPLAAAEAPPDERRETAGSAITTVEAPPAEPTDTAPPADAVASGDASPPASAFPHAGSITYELFYGTDKLSVGRSVQTWSIEHGSYRLTSFSVTTGLVGLFRPYQYAYVSEGSVDENGLRPLSFTMSRGRGGERHAMARFDWSLHQLTYGPMHKPRRVPLEPGTYDFLSFIYQLARTRLAPGRLELTITTGTRLDTYLLEVGAEEDVQLPLGTVRAIPVRQVQISGEESVQLWLAAEHPQLPLRIRFLDRNGRMTVDQLATKIEIERA